MKKLLTLALLLCTTLLSAQTKSITEWQEIDTLIAKGHYTSAYEKGVRLLDKYQSKKDSHGMLRVAYLLQKAEARYQEKATDKALERYKEIAPKLNKTDGAIAHMLVANIYRNYYNSNRYRINRNATVEKPSMDYTTWSRKTFIDTIGHYYALALHEREALLQCPVEQCDILTDGNEKGRQLRPTLYDVIVQDILTRSEGVESNETSVSLLANDSLYGDASLFVQMQLPASEQPYIRQLALLQALTQAHLQGDKALRAALDLQRMQFIQRAAQLYNPDLYTKGLEDMVAKYPKEESTAMMLYLLASYYVSGGYNDDTPIEHVEKAIAYCKQAIALAPYSEGGKQCQQLYNGIKAPYIRLTLPEVVLSEELQPIKVRYGNVENLYFKIVRGSIEEENYTITRKEVCSRSAVRSWSVKTSGNGSFIRQEMLADLPPLESGVYWLVASNSPEFTDEKYVNYVRFESSRIMPILSRDWSQQTVNGIVVDNKTGAAINDCEISLMQWKQERKKDGTSAPKFILIDRYYPDEKGYFTFPTGGLSGQYIIKVSDGISTSFRKVNFNQYERPYSNYNKHCSLFTDRYTYLPGDTVQFSLLLSSTSNLNRSVTPNKEITIILKDRNRKEIEKQKLTSDEFGHADGHFTIPSSTTPGIHYIDVKTLDEQYSNHINVEAFKAPTFTATLQQPKEVLCFGDSVIVKGNANTYTGLPVNSGKVSYKVTQYQHGLFRSRYWGSIPEHVAMGTTVTDEKGDFNIPFMAQHYGKPERNATYSYTVTADITDESGETHTYSTSFIVGFRTLQLQTEVPRVMMPGDSIRYAMNNLNGAPVERKVRMRIAQLTVPKTSRLTLYDTVDQSKWKEHKTYVDTELTTSPNGSRHYTPQHIPDGVYKVEFIYLDGDKEEKETSYFTQINRKSTKAPGLDLLFCYGPERSIRMGESATLYVGTPYEEVHVHYIVQQGYNIIDRGELTLSNQLVPLTIHAPEKGQDQIAVYLTTVKENVLGHGYHSFTVIPQLQELTVAVSTFRNYLQPSEKEQCTLSIKDCHGNPVEAVATVAIYNAALDVYGTSSWNIPTRRERYMNQSLWEFYNQTSSSGYQPSANSNIRNNKKQSIKYYLLPDVTAAQRLYAGNAYAEVGKIEEHSAPLEGMTVTCVEDQAESVSIKNTGLNLVGSSAQMGKGAMRLREVSPTYAESAEEESGTSTEAPALHLRKDLRHTALFLPTLRTDEQGQATFTVTAPDLLTQWHVKGIAHTKDLKHGRLNFDFVTRKTLMVQPHVPRFLYEGDKCDFTAKVSNSGDEPLEVVVTLETHLNPPCEGGLEAPRCQSTTISVGANSSTSVSFPIVAPAGTDYLTYRITAESLRYSDGEQARITVLPRRTLMTETMALYINGTEKRESIFDALKENHSETLEHKSLTLDIVSNPIWYAIEALSPLCKEENPSNERLFHRYYAATMGSYLIDRYPEVEGHSDFFRRDSLATLRNDLLNRLATNQSADGGWAWMNGFDSDRYTTLLIIKGLGELEGMGCISIAQNDTLYTMVKRGISYLDANYHASYKRMTRKPTTLDSYTLYYLYTRSMFPEIPFGETPSIAYDHYKKLLLADKATKGTLMQKAMKMLTLIRLTERNKATAIAEVVCQSSLSSDEMGTYWRDNTYGWAWDSNPIATQAMLIEAFTQLSQPADIIGRMQQWLLKQKQTTRWNNSIATAQAVHALVASPHPLPRRGDSFLARSVEVKVKNAQLNLIEENERGTTRYEVIPEKRNSAMPEIPILLKGAGNASPSWGSMTWQYYDDAANAKASGTGMTLQCTYYKVENCEGKEILTPLPEGLHKGDRIRVRLHFTTDRAMDYVELHLKRPAALEPVTTRSGYTYSNGLGYYRSIENTQTKFYFYRLNKGEYFIDCDLWVSQSGSYTCGVSTIQCMYAPSFMATAESRLLDIDE